MKPVNPLGESVLFCFVLTAKQNGWFNAPININSVGEGGGGVWRVRARGGDLKNFKIF